MTHRLSRYKKKERVVELEKPIEDRKGFKYYALWLIRNLYKSANFWVAFIFSVWGIIISYDNDKLGEEMKQLASDTKAIINEQKDLSTDQYNMLAYHYTFEEQKRLASVMDALNNISYQFLAIEPKLMYHRLQKQGKIFMVNRDVVARAEALELILSHLQQLGNIQDLTGSKAVGDMYNKCLNDIVELRIGHLYNISLGNREDTSRIGQEMYSDVMESIIGLEDTITGCMERQRDTLFASIREGEKNLEKFKVEMKKNYDKLKKEKEMRGKMTLPYNR